VRGTQRRPLYAALLLCLVLCGAQRLQPVTACLFTPDGASIVVAHHNAVVIRSVADGSQQRSLDINLQRISALAFDPRGQILAIAGGVPGASGTVIFWDWKANAAVGEAGGFQDVATAVAFSPDGSQLGIASADKSARIYQVKESGRQIEMATSLTGHAGPVLSIVFAPDVKTVLTSSADRSIKVWEPQTGKLIRTLTNHTDLVHCLAVRPSDQTSKQASWVAASAGDDRTVRIWQPAIGRMVRIIRKHEAPIFALAYAPDRSKLFAAGAEGIIRIIDADSDQILGEFKAHDEWIYTLATSLDGKWLASGDWGGNVRLWDLRVNTPKRAW
jgi:WD40 repeat protein